MEGTDEIDLLKIHKEDDFGGVTLRKKWELTPLFTGTFNEFTDKKTGSYH